MTIFFFPLKAERAKRRMTRRCDCTSSIFVPRPAGVEKRVTACCEQIDLRATTLLSCAASTQQH